MNNMSQDELAEKLNVSRQSVSLWENGQTQPTVENIIALSKILNVSADDLLGEGEPAESALDKPIPEKEKKRKVWPIIIIAVCAVLLIAVSVFALVWGKDLIGGGESSDTSTVSTTQNTGKTKAAGGTTATTAAKKTTAKAKTQAPRKTTAKTTARPTKTTTKTTTAKPKTKTTAKPVEQFDLFSYCKDFAIQIGRLNGDYTIYQKPSTDYGGYEGEYFSISYWADSDMVEFCLHCPLDDTYSINFYLRMRGGYDGKYEYLSSRYYRSDGESVRSVWGYIDPSIFSDSYPLSWEDYDGSLDKQTDFMEESRVGMCDLIKCLKQFVKVENMECGFGAFGFKNF